MTYRTGRQSPINIWLTRPGEDDVQVAMARTGHKATVLVDAANKAESIKAALAHHLDAGTDPCQDRGVHWPRYLAESAAAIPDGGE